MTMTQPCKWCGNTDRWINRREAGIWCGVCGLPGGRTFKPQPKPIHYRSRLEPGEYEPVKRHDGLGTGRYVSRQTTERAREMMLAERRAANENDDG